MLNYIKFDMFLNNYLDNPENNRSDKMPAKFETVPNERKAPVILETKKETSELNTDKLKTITNKEFLEIPLENRLQFITNPTKKSQDIKENDLIDFTFTFDGIFNKELYLKTTAGQVLPKEISEVKILDETYSRNNLSGEFFNTDNERLIIREKTNLVISKTIKGEDISKINEENDKKIKEYIESNKDSNPHIVKEAVNRGIDPKIACLILAGNLSKVNENERKISTEEVFTDFDRMKGNYKSGYENGKYSDEFIVNITKKYNPENYKTIAETAGVTISSIDSINYDENQAEKRRESIRSKNIELSKNFVENATVIAKEIEQVYGIPWQVTVGQACLESADGKSGLATKYNNYFGVKAGKSWDGEIAYMNTSEYTDDGKKYDTTDGFRIYESMRDSFIGYAEFLTKNTRYKYAFKYGYDIDPKPEYYPKDQKYGYYEGYNPTRFLEEIKKAGYATDPNYVSLVRHRLKEFNIELA